MRSVFAQFQRRMVFPGPEGVSVSLLNEVAGKVGATELRIATEDGEIRLITSGVYRDVVEKYGDDWQITDRLLNLELGF